MRKRIAPRKELEILLQSLKAHPDPKPRLEQYTISAEAAAETLFVAEYQHHDISGRVVADLGCGTGRLALGSAYLGAELVVGVDLDEKAIETARLNTTMSGQQGRVQWILSDVAAIRGSFDTVIQNPPFGVLRKGADRVFIVKALEIGKVVYSLHKTGVKNRAFIMRLAQKHGGTISEIYQLEFEIPHMFSFHRKKKHLVKVDLFRMVKNAQKHWKDNTVRGTRGETGGRRGIHPRQWHLRGEWDHILRDNRTGED